jgi:predicted MFS family arabinose efflux permease
VAGASPGRRASAIGGTIAFGGLAHLVGPTMAGFLGERVAIVVPFALVAGLAALAAAWLSLIPGLGKPVAEPGRLRDAVVAIRRHRELRGALVVMAVLGVVAGVVPLLVPLALDDNGLSAGQIGLVFSLSACVWVVVSALVSRLGSRAVRITAVAAALLALGAVFLLPMLTLTTAGIAAFLLLRAATHAPLSTICYPLAESGARQAQLGEGAAVGLANLVWAVFAAITPIVAAAVTGIVGVRATFGLVAIAILLAGLWLLPAGRRRHHGLEPASGELGLPRVHRLAAGQEGGLGSSS